MGEFVLRGHDKFCSHLEGRWWTEIGGQRREGGREGGSRGGFLRRKSWRRVGRGLRTEEMDYAMDIGIGKGI